MPSRRIDYYFPVVSASRRNQQRRLTFLDFPYAVREKIYKYTGIADGTVVDLNFINFRMYAKGEYPDATFSIHVSCRHHNEPLRRTDSLDEHWEMDMEVQETHFVHHCNCRWNSCAQGLLFVTKQISDEVQRLPFSHNRFQVDQGKPHGLRRLQLLSNRSLALLRYLDVRLDTESTYVMGDDTPEMPAPVCSRLKSSSAALKEWSRCIGCLAGGISPNQLSLYLTFRAVDVDSVQAVLSPMLALPQLKHCGIWVDITTSTKRKRLSQTEWSYHLVPLSCIRQKDQSTTSELSQLVHHTIKALTELTSAIASGFRYLDLPQEIRYQILEYTDLVHTDAVQWQPSSWPTPARGVYCVCSKDVLEEVGSCVCTFADDVQPHTSEYDESTPFEWEPCCKHCTPYTDTYTCMCSISKYMVSSSCRCPQKLDPLFLASRKVHQDAIPIYYSRNQFVVIPYNTPAMDPYRPSFYRPMHTWYNVAKTDLSLYLSSVIPGALQHIRWLEWALPDFHDSYLEPRRSAWHDHLDTIQLMQHAMNIPMLTFIINMTAARAQQDAYHRALSLESTNLWSRYERFVSAFALLHELKDFFVYLPMDIPGPFRQMMEQRFEQLVKGPRYDSKKRDKPAERFKWYYDYYYREGF